MDPKHARRIGRGSCGSVWTYDPETPHCRPDSRRTTYGYDGPSISAKFLTPTVFKVEDGSRAPGHLANDHAYSVRIHRALTGNDIAVPRPIAYNHPQILAEPDRAGNHPNTFKMERIRSVSPEKRAQYIQLNYGHLPQARQAEALEASGDCLMRVYLGASPPTRQRRMISMKNALLYASQVDGNTTGMGLDSRDLARIMGQTLAVLHWEVGTDANDVEFVLGAARDDTENTQEDRLWLLDFDCCNEMTADMAGIKKAVHAFFLNDPYYPRPRPSSMPVWNAFKEEYVATSERIMRRLYGESDIRQKLPQIFIDGIETRHAENEARKLARGGLHDDKDEKSTLGTADDHSSLGNTAPEKNENARPAPGGFQGTTTVNTGMGNSKPTAVFPRPALHMADDPFFTPAERPSARDHSSPTSNNSGTLWRSSSSPQHEQHQDTQPAVPGA